ncbi:MAG TPA: histidine kinase [Acidimicrobiales bacterium]|nr:histidine kinase [Acidimicrobiales bacterium]
MSTAASNPAGFPRWTARHAPGLLVALHLPFVVAPPVYTIARHESLGLGGSTLIALAAVALGGLQLRHSLAAARGERPPVWAATLLAVALLAYVPSWWFSWDWADTQWFVLASAAMLLRGRLAVAVVAGVVLGNLVLFARSFWVAGASEGETVFWTLYWLAIVVMGAVALYGSARLVRVVEELYAARLELAEMAVGRERLRVSRDLHDLLGQSLSAVSLKGDLALRLLPSDTEAARAEIVGLTEVARDALRGVRAVTHDRHEVSLRREIDAATALLAAAGVDTRIRLDLPEPEPGPDAAVGDVLGWAVREGTTNLLRHSEAQACWLSAERRDGVVRLEIVNDGVRGPAGGGPGSGLAGLAERARALSGTVTGARLPDGRFRLVVEIPEAAEEHA